MMRGGYYCRDCGTVQSLPAGACYCRKCGGLGLFGYNNRAPIRNGLKCPVEGCSATFWDDDCTGPLDMSGHLMLSHGGTHHRWGKRGWCLKCGAPQTQPELPCDKTQKAARLQDGARR